MNYPLVIKVLGYTLWVEAGCMGLPLLFLAHLPRSSGAGAVCPMRAEQPGPIKNKWVAASAGAYLVAYLLLLLVGAAVVAWGRTTLPRPLPSCWPASATSAPPWAASARWAISAA